MPESRIEIRTSARPASARPAKTGTHPETNAAPKVGMRIGMKADAHSEKVYVHGEQMHVSLVTHEKFLFFMKMTL